MSVIRKLAPFLVAVAIAGFVGYIVNGVDASAGGRVYFSGNPATNNGATCTACHESVAAPAVVISGPAVVDANSSNNYSVTITGGPAVTAGFDVSVSGNSGVLGTVDSSTELIGGEITHSDPKAFAGGSASFDFTWTAPNMNGSVVMYAAGNSSSGGGDTAGDGINTGTLLITVQNGLSATATPTSEPPAGISLQQVAAGLSEPVVITHAMDNRLFVVEQAGRIRIIDEGGSLLPAPFLDISGSVDSTHNEQGLLGLAFHPDYAANGFFYVYYTVDPAGDNADRTRVSRFTASGSPDIANAASEQIMLEFEQPYGNHNAGDLQFGPDGYLYITSGDGGGSYWNSVAVSPTPESFGQDPTELLGKVLRIDVDGSGGSDCDITGSNNYAIPGDNSYTDGPGGAGCDEIWANGLRNPWRMGFDRANGDLWLSDVGQSDWEEVNYAPAYTAGGANYGWSCFEATHPTDNTIFDDSACLDLSAYDSPVHEISHAAGDCSITGGTVYRGSGFLDLYGSYFFSDYCRSSIRTLTGVLPDGLTETEVLAANQFSSPSTFGQGATGELYVASRSGGVVSRILGETPAPAQAAVYLAASAPLIDGVVDSVWDSAQQHRINNLVLGSAPLFDMNLAGRFRTLYDAANLYLLAEITDNALVNDGPNWYQDDVVEIYLDGDLSQGSTCPGGVTPPHCYDGVNDFELGFRFGDPNAIQGLYSAPVPAGTSFVLIDTPTGYLLEVKLPLAQLAIAPAHGTQFGIDVHVVDDDDGGDRERKLAWFNTADDSWQYPQNFTLGTLIDPAVPTPTATATPSPSPTPIAGACGTQAVLFVLNNPSVPEADDQSLIDHLTANGYTVTLVEDDASSSGDAAGKDLVIISDSVASNSLSSKFRDVPAPVLIWEDALFDDMQMTGSTGTDHGIQNNQTAVSITDSAHPLAAGLSGTQATTGGSQTYIWGVPSAGAAKVATIDGSSARAVIFGYESGAAMVGLNAPARRTGFFSGTGFDFTSAGWDLFDAAVEWTAGCIRPASAGGLVWQDANADMTPEAETAVSGAPVQLLVQVTQSAAAGVPGTLRLAGTPTSADSGRNYVFDNLEGGTYFVDVDESALNDTYPVNTTGNLAPETAVLAASEHKPDINFGYQALAGGMSGAGSKVFVDADGSGDLNAGDAGLCNIEVYLKDSAGDLVLDGSSSPVYASSDSFGNFAFVNLAPGTYFLAVSQDDADLDPHIAAEVDGIPGTVQNCDPAANQIAAPPAAPANQTEEAFRLDAAPSNETENEVTLTADTFSTAQGFGFLPVPTVLTLKSAPAAPAQRVVTWLYAGLLALATALLLVSATRKPTIFRK